MTNRKKVVILIIAHKSELSADEISSLKQCYKVLANYPIKLICPEGLDVSEYKKVNSSADIDFIDPKWQATYAMFNRLKIESFIYNRYKDYQYILYYELDAWVFRDELLKWCDAGYDYIGAPWIEKVENGKPIFYPKGGNGGFSLRNVQSHLKIVENWKIMRTPKEVWSDYKKLNTNFNLLIKLPFVLLRMCGYKNNTIDYIKNLNYYVNVNEDFFWCRHTEKLSSSFKLAGPEVSLQFSFETNPSLLFELNNKQLPFGCHAWARYEPEFWEPFIKNNS